jgi:hypothetical protein
VNVARVVPVFSLSVARDLSRLEDVVTQILAWHGDPTAG